MVPRPHAPGPERVQRLESGPRADPHAKRRFLTAGTEAPAPSFREDIPGPRRLGPSPRGPLQQKLLDAPSPFPRPQGSPRRPASALGHQRDQAATAAPGARAPRGAGGDLGLPPPGTQTPPRASHPVPGRPRHPPAGSPAAPSSSSTVGGTSAYYLVHL